MKTIALKPFVLFVSLCLVFLSLIGCPPQENKTVPAQKSDVSVNTITDATGIPLILPITTQRIISLAPSITENIKILHCENALVGRTDFCKSAKPAESIGNIIEPSIEKIISLKPDLVMATKEGNRPQTIQRLRGLQVPVFVFGESNSWEDIESNFRLYGKLLNKTNESEKVLTDVTAELSQSLVTITDIGSLQKMFIQLNVTPLITAGRNTFINDIIKYAGGRNIAADSILPWPTLSVEEIIQRNPDVIIISDMGQITEQAKQMWQQERFAGVSAVKNKKIYVMESDLLCQPTPINFIMAVRQVSECLK